MVKLLENVENIEKNFARASVLGYPVDVVSLNEALEYAKYSISKSKGIQVITINPEMIMQALKNPALGRVLKNSDLIIPDGVGIVKILKHLGFRKVKQLPGIEFSMALIEKSIQENYKLAFLGASTDTIEAMTENLRNKYSNINIVYANDGYFSEDQEERIVQDLNAASPDVIFVALGVPRQEIWIEKYKVKFPAAVMAGVGGSFDVWADKVKRAPFIFRKLGLEWFYRLITQPSRFSRMFPALPLFFIKVMLDRKNTRKEY